MKRVQNIFLVHLRTSRRAILLKIPVLFFQENQKYYKNTYKFSRRGKLKCTSRAHQNFQESFLKILQEHIRFSRRRKYRKNRSNFPGELSQNFVRTDTIFQKTLPPRTDILQNYLVECFRHLVQYEILKAAFGFWALSEIIPAIYAKKNSL